MMPPSCFPSAILFSSPKKIQTPPASLPLSFCSLAFFFSPLCVFLSKPSPTLLFLHKPAWLLNHQQHGLLALLLPRPIRHSVCRKRAPLLISKRNAKKSRKLSPGSLTKRGLHRGFFL